MKFKGKMQVAKVYNTILVPEVWTVKNKYRNPWRIKRKLMSFFCPLIIMIQSYTYLSVDDKGTEENVYILPFPLSIMQNTFVPLSGDDSILDHNKLNNV